MGSDVAPRKEFLVAGRLPGRRGPRLLGRRVGSSRPAACSRPVSTSYMKPPTATCSGISGWARTRATSSRERGRAGRRRRGRAARRRPCRPTAPTRSRSSSSVEEAIAQRVCGTTRIRSTPSRCTPSTSASSACGGDPATGVAEDLRVAVAAGRACRSGSIRESMQVTMATPACATPSKPPSVEGLGELRVGGEQVVEVVGHGRHTGRQPRGSPPEQRPGCAAPRNSTSASTPATTAQTAAPAKTVCSWAMPACLEQVV